MKLIEDIVWSDLCVSTDPSTSWYKETPDAMVASVVPAEARDELRALWDHLEDTWAIKGRDVSRHGLSVTWPANGGMRLRAKRIPLANENHVYVCRAFRFKPKKFSEIGLSPPIAARMLSPDLRNGIGIILGRPGAGKTTTGTSYIQARAEQLGGVTWTIETPVEIELEGRYGQGYIHQRELDLPEMMGEAIRDLARATPNVLFVGEVIDDATAEAVVQASKMGFLVICTYHGNDLINGIERFARAAGRGHISSQFIESFRFAVHVDLRLAAGQGAPPPKPLPDPFISTMTSGTPPRVLAARSLFCLGETDPCRGFMKDGDFQKLNSEIERQKGELLKDLQQLRGVRQGAVGTR